METKNFNKLLLKTAFSCMACDGEIDHREVKLIKMLHDSHQTFGDIDIQSELDSLLLAINHDGHKFLKDYFSELSSASLSQENELKLIEVAIDTIKADDEVEYSEVKFFKVIRSKLKIDDEPILEIHPDFEEYLEQDIMSNSYLSKLQDDFFDTHISTEFKLVNEISTNILNNIDLNN
jgi:uncharacterized tellurite resistance protein B-like protein